MTERDIQESKFSQRTTTYNHSLASTGRKQLFETANYLLCQLALQIQKLERTNANDGDGKRPEQSEQAKKETPE